jgi:hypothetical protein
MRFVFLTVMITILWDVMPCSLEAVTGVSDEVVASIFTSIIVGIRRTEGTVLVFRVEEYETVVLFYSEDGGSTFLRNVGNDLSSPVVLHLGRQ